MVIQVIMEGSPFHANIIGIFGDVMWMTCQFFMFNNSYFKFELVLKPISSQYGLRNCMWNFKKTMHVYNVEVYKQSMHDEPIAHLYTNKKMRVRVSTSNNKRFICTIRRDATVSELAQAILERYNSLISDPLHRYFKEGFTATRIMNLRQRSFYLSRTDYVSDLLNDDDQVECDVEEFGKRQLKKVIKQEKYSRMMAISEEESIEKEVLEKPKKPKKHKRKQKGVKSKKEVIQIHIEEPNTSPAVVKPEEFRFEEKQQHKHQETKHSNHKSQKQATPHLSINQQTSIEPIRSPTLSPPKQQPINSHQKIIISSKSITDHLDKIHKPQIHLDIKRQPNSQNMRSSQRSTDSLQENSHKLKHNQNNGFKYPQKTDRSNPRTPEVNPIKSPNLKPGSLKKLEPQKLNLDSKKPQKQNSVEKHPGSRKNSEIQVVQSDDEPFEKHTHKINVPGKKQNKELFRMGHVPPPDHSKIFKDFLNEQDDNSN